jgi:dTDP-4-amino-4,6-dideoxygalactose transaminase
LASRYAEVLDPIAGVDLVPWEEGSVHHILAIRVDEADRDRIREALALREIGTGIHYPVPLSEQAAMSPWARPTPVSEAAGRELISLPMDPLMTLEMVDVVALALSEVVA